MGFEYELYEAPDKKFGSMSEVPQGGDDDDGDGGGYDGGGDDDNGDGDETSR